MAHAKCRKLDENNSIGIGFTPFIGSQRMMFRLRPVLLLQSKCSMFSIRDVSSVVKSKVFLKLRVTEWTITLCMSFEKAKNDENNSCIVLSRVVVRLIFQKNLKHYLFIDLFMLFLIRGIHSFPIITLNEMLTFPLLWIELLYFGKCSLKWNNDEARFVRWHHMINL